MSDLNKPRKSNSNYRNPHHNLKNDWAYLGQGICSDPTLTDSTMKGRWTIDYTKNNGKTFSKLSTDI
jgi:hypothetical protein